MKKMKEETLKRIFRFKVGLINAIGWLKLPEITDGN